VVQISGDLQRRYPEFSLQSVSIDDLASFEKHLTREQSTLLRGTIQNRDLTKLARAELGGSSMRHRHIGELLSQHQTVLRDVLRISTPKIDRMLAAAVAAGAYGGKINGSGGGGCMFGYAPEHPDRVARAVEEAGGKAYIVSMDSGVRVDALQEETALS
jgi:galactokinase